MSYDFDLFRMPPGMDLAAALEARDQSVLQDQPSQSDLEANRLIVSALLATNPRLEIIETSDYVELDAGADGNGIEISLFDDEAAVAVPYWHALPESRSVFEEIWGYLRIIQDNINYAIYDPQMDRLLNLDSDFEEVVALYSMMVAHIRSQQQ